MENKFFHPDQISKNLSPTICEKLLFCHELLRQHRKKKRHIRRWQPNLTEEERFLFENEELLSADLNIIANACGQHQTKFLQNRLSIPDSHIPIHYFCRKGMYPETSIQRQQMSDDQVPWIVDFPAYNPPYYTQPSLLHPSDQIDPEKISSNFMWNTFDTNSNVDRRTANPTGHYLIDKHGYPLNPLGRTGLRGRGELKRWSVNYLTHLVILCGTNQMKSGKEIFKYLMKKTKTNSYYQIPSTWTTGTNMTAVSKTLQTYLLNIYRTWNKINENVESKIEEIIKHITFVSTAYIDDAKNTDNAWLETSVCCYIQTNLNPNLSSNPQIDLNELFPDPPFSSSSSSSSSIEENFIWQESTRSSSLLDSERDVLRLIAKRYNAYW